MKDFETFSELENTKQSRAGTRFICRERSNANYILQPSGYVALAGDVTFANGRVGALQRSYEGWNFLHFGVSPSGSGAANSDAFDDAIERAGTRVITGPSGFYVIERTIEWTLDRGGIASSDDGLIELYMNTSNTTHLKFSKASPELDQFINYNTVKGVRLFRDTGVANTNSTAIELNNVRGFNLDGVLIEGSHCLFKIRGIEFSNFTNIDAITFQSGITNNTSRSAIEYGGYPLSGGGTSVAYTTNFNNFNIRASASGHSLELAQSDGLNFNNGYFGKAITSHVNIEHNTDNTFISEVKFNAIYFDGVSPTTGSVSSLTIPAIVGTGRVIAEIEYCNCNINNFTGDAVSVQGLVRSLTFDSVKIANVQGWGVNHTAPAGDFLFVGSSGVSNANMATGSGAMTFGAADNVNVSAAFFKNTTGGVTFTNTKTTTIIGSQFYNVTTEITQSGVTKYRAVGNQSNLSTLTDV